MTLRDFKSNSRLVYAVVAVITFLLLALPARPTLVLALKYFDLQEKSNSSTYSLQAPRLATDTILLKEIDFAKKVFNDISYSCQVYKVVIKQIELPVLTTLPSGVTEQTQQITLAGNFVDILKTLDDIKEKIKPIKIVSIMFTSIDNNKTLLLEAHVVVQSVKKGEVVNN
jgi:hypothetical protein